MVGFAFELSLLAEITRVACMHVVLEELEHLCILHFMVAFDGGFGVVVRVADLFSLEYLLVENAGEVDSSLIIHIRACFDAYNVLNTEFVEHLAEELGCAGRKVDKVECGCLLCDQVLQCFSLYSDSFASCHFEK